MASVHSIVTPVAGNGKRQLIDNGDGTHSVPTNRPGVFALIDSDLAEVVGLRNWFVHKAGNREYIQAHTHYQGGRLRVKLHHFVAGRPLGKLETDHINHDTFDNRRANLRIVTHQENSCNRRAKNPTGFIGVNTAGRRFGAGIEIKNKAVSLGVRDTAEEAAKLYDAAREILGFDPLFGNHLPLSLEDYYQAGSRLRDRLRPKTIVVKRGDTLPVKVFIGSGFAFR